MSHDSSLLQRRSTALLEQDDDRKYKAITNNDRHNDTLSFPGNEGPGHNFLHIPLFPSSPVSVQPKLKISDPHDKYEQEADRVADQVMRMPEPHVQRRPG